MLHLQRFCVLVSSQQLFIVAFWDCSLGSFWVFAMTTRVEASSPPLFPPSLLICAPKFPVLHLSTLPFWAHAPNLSAQVLCLPWGYTALAVSFFRLRRLRTPLFGEAGRGGLGSGLHLSAFLGSWQQKQFSKSVGRLQRGIEEDREVSWPR